MTKEWWAGNIGEIFWPWYTLIGLFVMLTVTFITRAILKEKPPA